MANATTGTLKRKPQHESGMTNEATEDKPRGRDDDIAVIGQVKNDDIEYQHGSYSSFSFANLYRMVGMFFIKGDGDVVRLMGDYCGWAVVRPVYTDGRLDPNHVGTVDLIPWDRFDSNYSPIYPDGIEQ